MVNKESVSNVETDPSILFGKFLSHPPPGEEIVISGISGRYPDSHDVYHFRDNLFNKVDMITDDTRRWEPYHPEIPQRTGKLIDIRKYDAGFFGTDKAQSDDLEPMLKILLECSTEAIMDAGYQPADFENTNTSVFGGICFPESEQMLPQAKQFKPGMKFFTGCIRTMLANRISYYFKLKGQSVCIDTACSSSLVAMEHAYVAIRKGECDRAIVFGTNLCLNPVVALQFARLGVLSKEGKCRSFDIDGQGYAKSEVVCAIIIEKAKEAKRIYSTVLHCKTNCDGFKQEGITYPSGKEQCRLIEDIYTECGIKPNQLSYLEAHGTGTPVGDPEEGKGIDNVFTKGRSKPLLLGSVKSNIGHSEPASGLGSVTKALIAFETGFIPPNIHFNKPRPDLLGIIEGRLQVVTEKTAFQDDRGLIGINSFGFGGANCHVLLKHNTKTKVGGAHPRDNIPRLICVSGRTEEAIDSLLNDVLENNLDVEQIRLLQNIFRKNIPGHPYRGFSVITRKGEIKRSSAIYCHTKTPLHLVLGRANKALLNLGEKLKVVPTFNNSLKRIQDAMVDKKVNLEKHLTSASQSSSGLNKALAGVVIQIAIIDLLRELEIEPKKVTGYSVGGIVRAYYEGTLTLKQTLERALLIDEETNENNTKTFLNGWDGTIPNRLINKLDEKAIILEFGQGIPADRRSKLELLSVNSEGDELASFFQSIGRLYELGHDVQLHKIYPKVNFPVSRGTPMISPKIRWNHSKEYYVVHYLDLKKAGGKEQESYSIKITEDLWSYVGGHVVDGRNLFPATGYLNLVWQTFAAMNGKMPRDMCIKLENCKFRRACTVPQGDQNQALSLTVAIQRGSNSFEVLEGDIAVVTGTVKSIEVEKNYEVPHSINSVEKGPDHDTMTSKDIYKELRLRGYNYKGLFRGLLECKENATIGTVKWQDNFVAFMDNMLQIKILQEDSRLLYVPTSIRSITIDCPSHMAYMGKLAKEQNQPTENEALVPISICHKSDAVRSGHIEIVGLIASSIGKRKNMKIPVLEKYEFVPNEAVLPLSVAVRINIQIILENTLAIKNRVVELVDNATTSDQLLSSYVKQALEDQPLIQPDIKIFSKNSLEIEGIEVENKLLKLETDCTLVIGSNLLVRKAVLDEALKALKVGGYVISRESLTSDLNFQNNAAVITVFSTNEEKIVLLTKKSPMNPATLVNASLKSKKFDFLPKLQHAVKNSQNVVVYAQDEPLNGVIGLVNCARREPGCDNVKCVFIVDKAPSFDPNHEFYKKQLDKNMAVNVFKDGKWGTYRHLALDELQEIESEHCYVNSTRRGDLSSLKWVEAPLRHNTVFPPSESAAVVATYYSSINFRDIMTASGKINVDVITRDRREQECVQGFEFSGRIVSSGKRVMGMIGQGALSTLVKADPHLLWDVPDHWSLEEAATVPVVYATCLFALHNVGYIRPLDSILIHSGTGGIGQAAINLCLNLGCKIFVTVGTKEKREFLKKHFPKIKESHIGNSRDLSFEQMIKKETHGRGVDIVLNSLAEEKLLASIRCLAEGGRFLEIGKFDLANNNTINLALLEKGASYHGVMLDKLFNAAPAAKASIAEMIKKGVQDGGIKPLVRTVFEIDEVEKAFRYMGAGKHMGKVLIKIRQEENQKICRPPVQKFKAMPRYFCDETKSYVICGGLGGFGLELTDWLVLRGAKNLILSSRKGVSTGYQTYRMKIWKSYGCNVKISTQDITTQEGCEALIKEANTLGPVDAIFNLAVVLRDAILENQTVETFQTSFGPKAYATAHLDEITRRLCPELKDFVIFSSVSCGRGNAGQTNYGMSNSVMERICEKRRQEGLPALAIEWGAIADVGIVAEMQEEHFEMEIGGTLQQSIANCLEVMDLFMRQKEGVIVSSVVVAEKKISGSSSNIMEAVANIIGIRDLKTVSWHASLAEIGMDSMNAVEIKQILEREFEIILTPDEIRSLTFTKIHELQDKTESNEIVKDQVHSEQALLGFDILLRSFGDEKTASLPILRLPSKQRDPKNAGPRPKVFMFPGIDNCWTSLGVLAANLDAEVFGLQYSLYEQQDTIREMSDYLLPYILEVLPATEPFHLVCHSYGTTVALEVTIKLEKLGYHGTLTSIDGSPNQTKRFLKLVNIESEEEMAHSVILASVKLLMPGTSSEVLKQIFEKPTLEEKLDTSVSLTSIETEHSTQFIKGSFLAFAKRIKTIRDYEWESKSKIASSVTLIKPTLSSLMNIEDDYGLSKYCSTVDVKTFEGNHMTVLENEDIAQAILTSINMTNGVTNNE